jgi:hypothetical protein
MEQKIDMKQDRENEKFWQYWMKGESTLVVGNDLNSIPEVKKEVANKLGLHKRSITPTTLKKIVFDNTPDKDLSYREIYSYKDNAVTRFAFNEKLLPYEQFVDSKKLGSWKSSTKSTKAIQTNADRIELNKLEKYLLKESINYLVETKQKTVVVDIFARDQGQIKNDKGFVELHSVVLVHSNEKIYVIDPSNFSFSCHLSNLNKDLIVTRYSTDKIYEPPSGTKSEIGKKLVNEYDSVTGPSKNQYRDCIDIAVKLALGLSAKEDFNFDNIIELDVAQEITNNPEINNNIIDLDSSLRIKQATSSSIRHNFELLVDRIQKLFKHSFIVNNDVKSEKHKNFEQIYKELLATDITSDDYNVCFDNLKIFHEEFYKETKDIIGKCHDEILFDL